MVDVYKENKIKKLQVILNHIKTRDPQFRSLIMYEIRDNQKRQKQNEIAKETIRRLRIQNKKLLEQVASLKVQSKQMKLDKNEILIKLNDLVKLNNSLSGALGSCSACWGEDPQCDKCTGNGSSGWQVYNKRLFNIYVLPTLEKKYGLKIGKKNSIKPLKVDYNEIR